MNDREKSRSGAGGNKYLYAGDFDYNLPRPPALGEERVYGPTERAVFQPHLEFPSKAAAPVPKINYDIDEKPPIPTAGCLSWAKSLHNLLQDPDGVELFLRYLESEGPQHADTLKFWFACEGLKNQNQMEKKQKLVKLIYKNYFVRTALPINDDLRKEITRIMKSQQCLQLPVTLFDEAQAQIEHLINKTTYPNFLKSDVYVEYLQSADNVSKEESSSSSSSGDLRNLASGMGPLPTLHEEMEYHVPSQPSLLVTPGTASVSTGYHTPTLRLTKDILLRSQKQRAYDKSKSETFANLIYRNNGTHVLYNGYNPVSRVDSERQSLSSHSDATTESDKMSLNERTIDGRISGRSKHKSFEEKQARHLAARNNEVNMDFKLIPRTQQLHHFVSKVMPIKEHAALLTKKLLNLQHEREKEELLNKKLKENESNDVIDDKLGTAMREKLQFQDDNDQNILDEHVSRVFSDHSLSISPDVASPKPASPPRGRWLPGNRCMPDSSNMSLLPMAPNTALQLEEIKRRLTEADGKSKSKHRSSKKYPEFSQQSRQSTLRKSGRSQRPNQASSTEDVTTVVIFFSEEEVPYLVKIPGSQTTLKLFKEYLPKKGNYRFFFKTVCEDLSNQVTHKEVTNDNEILPFWEGKIMAQAKPVD